MCDFKETTRRLLTIPPDFVPYMEKHKLYEFFYELVTQLLIQQPEDPIVFMKQCIQHAIRKRDIARIILIAPPSFDKLTFAKILQEEIGNRPVTLNDLRALSSTENMCYCYNANEIAMRMKEMLMSGILHESGWTLVDIPRNKEEARAMQRVGIIPTHVIQVISSNENETQKDVRQSNYKRTLQGLREVYTNLLIEVEASGKTIRELCKDCAKLTKIGKHYGAPSLFRIVLIGPRGSGRHSLAKHISERFNVVHVDFNHILEQACLQEAALGEMLRLCEHRCGHKLKSEARIQIVEQYILGSECLRKGWILTDYPKTMEEFKLLDMISTPPNRIIILKVDVQICRERLLNCRHNVITENEHNRHYPASCESLGIDPDCKLDVYSKNYKNIVEQDLWEYQKNIEDIMQYAGETATIIDATNERKFVRENLEACLMRPTPSAKSRIPQLPPTIDPLDVEFDPDDEPDPKIFDDIRVPEPEYSFI